MGKLDTVKSKAGDLAEGAERAGRMAAAQARIVVLKNDLKKAERELGKGAFTLYEQGHLEYPELAAAIVRVQSAHKAIEAKEAEIADLRAAGDDVTGQVVCGSCGAELPDEAQWCTSCGAAVAEEAPLPAAPSPTAGASFSEPATEAAATAMKEADETTAQDEAAETTTGA